jgi:acetyltransferase-like isoleucine patch superfamily enzyme
MKTNFVDLLICQLLSRYESLKERQRQEYFRQIAVLAPTATIGPEGTIENIFGDPHAIAVGDNSYLRGRLLTYGHGGRIIFGDWCYLGERSEIWPMESIEIGNRVLIAHDVNIHDGTAHSKNSIERHDHYQLILRAGHPRSPDDMPGFFSAPIVIEDDVWISFGVTILKGVGIGAGSIIAAKSIVTKEVPPHVVYRNDIVPVITPCS